MKLTLIFVNIKINNSKTNFIFCLEIIIESENKFKKLEVYRNQIILTVFLYFLRK